MSALVNVADLKVHFKIRSGLRTRSVRAVDGVAISLKRGQTLGLVGESGSGKTTLGRAMLRLLDPVGGTIVFDGQDITDTAYSRLKPFRRRAQAIFQDPYSSISPYMNVRAIVEEPLLIHGPRRKREREERVIQALRLVKLEPVDETLGKYPHSLSGGQRQRVCIARAVVLQPEFIVADEPVSMVDASNRSEILYLLRELQLQQTIAFLYITHDIASARHFSDRVAVMYLGTIVELGPTAKVIDEPLHPYTRGLLAAVPEPDPQNRSRLRAVIPGEPPSAAQVPSGCPFHPRCKQVVAGTCDLRRPALTQIHAGHQVACHLYN